MILMYHNIVPDTAPMGHKFIGITLTKSVFLWQMKFLKTFFKIVSLSEYIDRSANNNFKLRKTIAITFDDGTWHTYKNGSDIWNKLKIPVTLFVNSCHLDGKLIWGSYLNALCFEGVYDEILISNRSLSLKTKNDKTNVKKSLHDLSLKYGDQDLFFKELSLKYPIPENILDFYKGMSSIQLKDASSNPLVNIGGHTHTHPSLNILDYQSQLIEIKMNKDILEKNLNKKVTDFAYPSGLYNSETIAVLKENDYISACAVKSKKIINEKNNYELQRVGIFRKTKIEFLLIILKGIFN